MKHLLSMLLAIMTLSVSAQSIQVMEKFENQLPRQGRGNAKVAYDGRSVDQMIYEFMEEEGIPGMTLAIVQAPYIPRVVGYGVTDLEYGKLATEKTLWNVGPIAQGYAAVAIMQLYERGKLNLSDPVAKYVKGFPNEWGDVTIKQLMQHSTGIADYREMPGFDASAVYSDSELLAYAYSQPRAFTSGTDVRQSATNSLLLANVIENVSKMPYESFVRKYQLDYMGLKQTFFTSELGQLKTEDVSLTGGRHKTFTIDKDYVNPSEPSQGYSESKGMLIPVKRQSSTMFKGFSDVWASAENISHWDIGLAGAILISKPENRDIVYKPTTLENGKVVPAMAGWQFYAHKGLMDIKGNSPGHSSFLSRFTDSSELVCVTLLANKEGVEMTNLARRIAAAFDNQKLGTGVDDNALYSFESQFGVDETVENIQNNLKKQGVPVFAVFDHGKNAEEVSLELRPTKVVVFGAPKVGTKLMQENQSISLELPLKISVFEDEKGSVWAVFPKMDLIAERYSIGNAEIIAKMQGMLEELVVKSSSVY